MSWHSFFRIDSGFARPVPDHCDRAKPRSPGPVRDGDGWRVMTQFVFLPFLSFGKTSRSHPENLAKFLIAFIFKFPDRRAGRKSTQDQSPAVCESSGKPISRYATRSETAVKTSGHV